MLKATLTIVALLSCPRPAAGSPRPDTLETTLRAIGSVSVSKYTESGVTRYDLLYDDLGYGQWYNVYPPVDGHEHAALLFDLSAIPDTADIVACELRFFQCSDDTAGTPPYEVRGFDYAGQEPESLFMAVESGALVVPEREAHHGWNRVLLNDTGVQWVQIRLSDNILHAAIKEDAWGELAYAYDSTDPETLRPYLLLSYLPTAVEERSTPAAPRPTLDITPNPCARTATIRFSSLLPTPYSLSVYDACGRVVLSQPVRTSSFVLSTSSFPPGVYVVELSAPRGTSLRQKLVVR
ncbi:MAG: T9SS type A sorting domain-containing protein [candidate division WOR-3 bacterium]|nr:T9SS type A sorting domain-containing protein [candidate division WOR-3 bacterium]